MIFQTNYNTTAKRWLLTGAAVVLLAGCATTPGTMSVNGSYLKAEPKKGATSAKPLTEAERVSVVKSESVTDIKPFSFKKQSTQAVNVLSAPFSQTKKVKIAADELPLNQFIHYVLGDVLDVSYILGAEVKEDDVALTLNLQESIDHYKLYELVEELLSERGYVIRFNDGIYYVNKEGGKDNRGKVDFGYGNQVKDVPNSTQMIWQMAPFDYGFNGSLQLTLSQLANVAVYPDSQQNLLMIRGKRNEIIKALEFMHLVDKPKLGQRKIALYKSTFVDAQTLIERLTLLMQQEGISVGQANDINRAISLVPLENMGAIALFANKNDVLKRAVFWLNTIDKPEEGDNLQYFIYGPQFSRASDLGLSLEALLGGASSTNSSTSVDKANKKSANSVTSTGITSSNVGMVIDERANSLIFQTTGDEYRKLLPLIKRLDVMPKQIMLEVIIAEVKLTDEFKQGVDFTLTNSGDSSITGGYNLKNTSTGLSYILTGTRGKLDVSLFQKNTNVNVLSRPSLLVRDGVTAQITVGDDIPTVGEIITDPTNGSQTSVVYRKTGVELGVTPTINAQGVVIMEIAQKISNQATGDESVAGSPIIFERNIKTEVVADSGQTIILGGLISEDRTVNDRTVPGFSSIPFIGHLFSSEDDTKTKTELVIMVTPRVIESNDEWQAIKQSLAKQLSFVELPK